jgi:SAM-dependent methyltransferase
MAPSDSSAWQSEELSHAFLEGVRGAIPAADLQLALIGRITDQWLPRVSGFLDLGCGDGILGKFLLSRLPAAHGLLLDFSEPMLEAARANLRDQPRAAIARADFGSPAWLEVARPAAPFQLVVSGFAIHHQPDARKRELYAEIFELLAPGGVFLNLEHVASASPAGESLFDDFFIDHLHAFHARRDPLADRASVARTFYNRTDKTENILAPVEEQCRWLRQIGFRDVDCFFKLFELALFGGRRPLAPAG